MISIRQKLRKISPWHREILPYDQATEDDLFYCYRLLLGREPDAEGWNNFMALLETVPLPVDALVDEFLNSAEFGTKQLKAAQTVLVELEKFKIYIRRKDYSIGSVIEKTHRYEPHVSVQLEKRLNEGDVFVDIGANIGFFTLMASLKVGTQGHVHSFEPHPDNLELLSKNIQINSLANVSVYPYAVAEERKTFRLGVSGSSSNATINDLVESLENEGDHALEIEARSLDEVLGKCNRINLIKMDIEGAEPRAWAGMHEIIQQFRPVVIMEFSPNLLQTTSHVEPTDFLHLVIQSGYDLFVIENVDGHLTGKLSPTEILNRRQRSGLTHLDLLAAPGK